MKGAQLRNKAQINWKKQQALLYMLGQQIKKFGLLQGCVHIFCLPSYETVNFTVSYNYSRKLIISVTYFDTWSGFEAAKTAPWPSQGLRHFGKFLEPSDE